MTERETIIGNICAFLSCGAEEVIGLNPLQKGLNNSSFSFICRGEKYVYRHPGVNASGVIDRKKEAAALLTARRLGLDGTLLHIDDEEGWKISRFIEVTEEFDFGSRRHAAMLAGHLRTLHSDGACAGFEFDYEAEADGLIDLIAQRDSGAHSALVEERERMAPVFERLKKDAWPKGLCHNDLYEPNLLVEGDRLHIIDWEFAGDSDIGYDICKLFCVSDPELRDTDGWLGLYYPDTISEDAKTHLIANAAVIYYYWYVWAVYAAGNGDKGSEYAPEWYGKMVRFRDEAAARL